MSFAVPADRASIVVSSLLVGAGASRCSRRPGQSEFVPVDALPPADQLPAAPLLITAYAFVWVAVDVLRVDDLAAAEQGRGRDARAGAEAAAP